MYAQRFAADTSSYINWVLDLELPVPGRRRDFEITAIYYRDNREHYPILTARGSGPTTVVG
jgi:hypothetical protein